MLISRTAFFGGLLALVLLPVWAVKLSWILSAQKTFATVAFQGKEITGQLQRHYSVLLFLTNNSDTVFFNTADNELYAPGSRLSIYYHPQNPGDAHVANFTGTWMEPVIYSCIALIIIFILFIHPDIVPRKTQLLINDRPPFLKIHKKNS